MPRRLALLCVVSLSLPLVTVEAARAAGTSRPQSARYAVSSISPTWFDAQRGRSVPVKVYYPANRSQRWPVVIFSSGLGRSRDDCAYLGRHWASCGYVVVHVQHQGSDEQVRKGSLRPRRELQQAFYSPRNTRDRPLDVIFVIDRLEQMQRAGAAPGSLCDLTRIGVAGHDFGAQTALALAGAVLPGHIAFVEPRVKAVVAMGAPVPLGQVPLGLAFGDVALPCLHITGTADDSIVATTKAYQRRLPFDHARSANQYLITLHGADHMTYAGHLRAVNGAQDTAFQRLIAECSATFWDAYLKTDADAITWLAGESFDQYLGGAGRVERKLIP